MSFAKTYQLTPGVALNAEQMALLTIDIVWLTPQTVTLADGSTTQVLVPQVYLRRTGDVALQADGALISARSIDLKSGGDIVNDNATLQAAGTMTLQSQGSISNLGGRLAAMDLGLNAGRNDNLRRCACMSENCQTLAGAPPRLAACPLRSCPPTPPTPPCRRTMRGSTGGCMSA